MASAIPVPDAPGRLYLVPNPTPDVVWEPRTPAQLEATVDWLAKLHFWGPLVIVPGILLVAAYWGPPRGPLFR